MQKTSTEFSYAVSYKGSKIDSSRLELVKRRLAASPRCCSFTHLEWAQADNYLRGRTSLLVSTHRDALDGTNTVYMSPVRVERQAHNQPSVARRSNPPTGPRKRLTLKCLPRSVGLSNGYVSPPAGNVWLFWYGLIFCRKQNINKKWPNESKRKQTKTRSK